MKANDINAMEEFDFVKHIYEAGLAEKILQTWVINNSFEKTADAFGLTKEVVERLINILHKEYPKVLLKTYPGLMDVKIDRNIDLYGHLLALIEDMKTIMDKSKQNGEIINDKSYFKAFQELKDILKFLVDKKTDIKKIFDLYKFKQIVMDELSKESPEVYDRVIKRLSEVSEG
jgi:hypothetical protein